MAGASKGTGTRWALSLEDSRAPPPTHPHAHARTPGGFYAWYRTFDNNLRKRRNGEYAETYTHDGDSCGIHASGGWVGACGGGGEVQVEWREARPLAAPPPLLTHARSARAHIAPPSPPPHTPSPPGAGFSRVDSVEKWVPPKF